MRVGVRIAALATLAGVAAIAAGCGGGTKHGSTNTSSTVKPEPQISLTQLRACLTRAKVPLAGSGGFSGKGVSGRIPLISVGASLDKSTDLLVFPSVSAATQFMAHPPPAASLVEPIARTGNVVKARSSTGGAPSTSENTAIDRCLKGP